MQIPRLETPLLTSLSLEALQLLRLGQFETLADQFGYVFANGREITAAIHGDLQFCMGKLGASSLINAGDEPSPTVQYYKPHNAADLLAAVSCVVTTDNGKHIFVDLVVRPNGRAMHLYLEDIHVPA